jgi:hypothetical protein
MSGPLLKRITGPDGELLITREYIEELRARYSTPEALQVFTARVANKFTELYNEKSHDLGVIAQFIDESGVSKYIFQNRLEIEGVVPKTFSILATDLQAAVEAGSLDHFVQAHDVFICNFNALATNKPRSVHAFILIKEDEEEVGEKVLSVIDPHGIPIGKSIGEGDNTVNSAFTEDQAQQLRTIFDGYFFADSSCILQGTLNTCGLWSYLLLIHKKQTVKEIQDLVYGIIFRLGYAEFNPVNVDLIVIAIFSKFLEEGFATEADIQRYPAGTYLNGLGKRCNKCGLPK